MNLAAAICLAAPKQPQRESAPSFRTLLGEQAWARLAAPIRARFGQDTARGDFTGDARLRANPIGRVIAHLIGVAGRPLPTLQGCCEARVTIRRGRHGAAWNRAYRKPGGGWQHVRSLKRQDGATLYECAGPVWMRLRLEEQAGALAFISTGFFVALGPLRLRLPDALTPGQLVVTHTDHGRGAFAFTLTCDHALFGRVFDQVVTLNDVTPEETQP